MQHPKLKQIMAQVKTLPSMPAAGTRMLTMLENPDTDIDEIEEVLRQDPGLTGNVLKLSNSVYFGIPSKIASVRQAVLLLGLKRLMQLVIASCVSAAMDKPIPGYDLPPGNLWKHSIAVSIAAEALARDQKNVDVDDIFTPALLHDVGKLVLGYFIQEELQTIEEITAKGVPYVVAENMVLGTDHAQIGAMILTQWAFPPSVIEAVRWHHDPDFPERPSRVVDVVYLANVLCQTNGTGAENGGQLMEISPAVIDRLGIDINGFEEITGKVAQWVDELAEALTFS